MWCRTDSGGMSRSAWFSASTCDPRAPLALLLVHRRVAEHVDQERVVDLEDEPGGDDGQVLLTHGLGDRVEVLLV